MRKLFAVLAFALSFAAQAQPLNISFNNSLPVSVSSTFPGCETKAYGYTFDVTMMGYNLPTTSCTATNLFQVANYITAGKAGAGTNVGSTFEMTAPQGVTFDLINFTVNDYGLKNTLRLDTVDSFGNFTTQLLPTYKGLHLYQIPNATGLVSATIHGTNNRIDITAIQIVDSAP